MEGFETGDFSKFPWQRSGNANWTTDATTSVSGGAARSGPIGNSQTSTLRGQWTRRRAASASSAGLLEDARLSTFLHQSGARARGLRNWLGHNNRMPVTTGNHIFTWTYSKDAAVQAAQTHLDRRHRVPQFGHCHSDRDQPIPVAGRNSLGLQRQRGRDLLGSRSGRGCHGPAAHRHGGKRRIYWGL